MRESSFFQVLYADLQAACRKDPVNPSQIEVICCYSGFHALCLHRMAHGIWKRGWRLPARILAGFSRFITGVEIHPAATIGKSVFIDHGMGVVIGETAIIEDDVTLYHEVTLGGLRQRGDGGDHARHPIVQQGAIIGAGAKVLGRVVIGAGARVGANAVVVSDVEAGTSVVGVPAHPMPADDSTSCNGYGTPSGEEPDPLLLEIQNLRREFEALKKKVSEYDI